jgi:hypothetical protein
MPKQPIRLRVKFDFGGEILFGMAGETSLGTSPEAIGFSVGNLWMLAPQFVQKERLELKSLLIIFRHF